MVVSICLAAKINVAGTKAAWQVKSGCFAEINGQSYVRITTCSARALRPLLSCKMDVPPAFIRVGSLEGIRKLMKLRNRAHYDEYRSASSSAQLDAFMSGSADDLNVKRIRIPRSAQQSLRDNPTMLTLNLPPCTYTTSTGKVRVLRPTQAHECLSIALSADDIETFIDVLCYSWR